MPKACLRWSGGKFFVFHLWPRRGRGLVFLFLLPLLAMAGTELMVLAPCFFAMRLGLLPLRFWPSAAARHGNSSSR